MIELPWSFQLPISNPFVDTFKEPNCATIKLVALPYACPYFLVTKVVMTIQLL